MGANMKTLISALGPPILWIICLGLNHPWASVLLLINNDHLPALVLLVVVVEVLEIVVVAVEVDVVVGVVVVVDLIVVVAVVGGLVVVVVVVGAGVVMGTGRAEKTY